MKKLNTYALKNMKKYGLKYSELSILHMLLLLLSVIYLKLMKDTATYLNFSNTIKHSGYFCSALLSQGQHMGNTLFIAKFHFFCQGILIGIVIHVWKMLKQLQWLIPEVKDKKNFLMLYAMVFVKI